MLRVFSACVLARLQMEQGDQGWRLSIRGLPYIGEGTSPQEAILRLGDMLGRVPTESGPGLCPVEAERDDERRRLQELMTVMEAEHGPVPDEVLREAEREWSDLEGP
ncbi:hypothetical protein O4J56_15005 [Nocardiopsis sp. RSe5-2]|uniref:Uncharacterized protein n=1 Tax=Nocardiopsis endophytica TaxID=3018445 RepID=A0ABT4U4R2_9ACTN|nr:hypothetical protein [Nocardiopsis endophytica]MDA2811949.1 hypothetical protein [Nocardiopsis endophytica]